MQLPVRKLAKYVLGKFGLELRRIQPEKTSPFIMGYVPAEQTVAEAAKAGLKVQDFLEQVWKVPGNRQAVIENLKGIGLFDRKIENICEIGTGAALYADKTIEICNPLSYESYEPDIGWANWLAKQYNIISHQADGKSLSETKTESMDLVCSHGVFVYLPFLITVRYFREIQRVLRPGGCAAFDVLSEDCFDEETLEKWVASGQTFPCMVSKDYVVKNFFKNGFSLKGECFNDRFNAGKSQYLVFQKHK